MGGSCKPPTHSGNQLYATQVNAEQFVMQWFPNLLYSAPFCDQEM